MKLVFCGTPRFAVPTLEAVLAAGHEVALVLSQPDKPVGRAAEVQVTPVKQAALAHNIEVLQPEKLKTNADLRAKLEAIAPDAILVVAYGRIIPQWMLDLPKHGNINLHGSLLPRWRGAAPIQWAVAAGDTVTGVTTMLLNAGLDTGPMLLKHEVPIGPHTTSPELFESLATIGADLMVKTLEGLENNLIVPIPQDDAEATLAPILTRDDARIDFSKTAQTIYNRFRAFQPWPGAFTSLRGKKLIIHKMHVAEANSASGGHSFSHINGSREKTTISAANNLALKGPGFSQANYAANEEGALAPEGVLLIHENNLLATCANNTAIVLEELQLEGKKRMPAADFLRGFQIKNGEQLG